MSDAFQALVNQTPTQTLVSISGVLGEEAKLPTLKTELPIRINLKNLTRLNSRGIKKWHTWINQFKAPAKIFLEECPANFINCFNMVKGSFTEIMRVESFYVPLFSPLTGECKDVLLTRGVHFSGESIAVPEERDSQGGLMEVDVHESYFSFLKPA